MMALIRYLLKDLGRSHRYAAPTLSFIVIVTWLYSLKPNPVLESYAFTAGLLFCLFTWLSLNFLTNEPPVQRQLTILHAGGSVRYHWGRIATLLLCASLLAAFSVILPTLTGAFNRHATVPEMAVAWYSHLVAAQLGFLLAWAALQVSERWLTVYGTVVFGICLSLASGGLEAKLPDPISWIVWLLPPIHPLMSGVNQLHEQGVGASLMSFLYPLIYAAMGLALLVYRSVRRRV